MTEAVPTAAAPAAPAAPAAQKSRPAKKKPRARRIFSELQKRSMVARAAALGLGNNRAAEKFDVARSVMHNWTLRYGSLRKAAARKAAKPQKAKSKKAKPKNRPISRRATFETKAEAVARLQAGGNWRDVARAYGVSSGTITNWRKAVKERSAEARHQQRLKEKAQAHTEIIQAINGEDQSSTAARSVKGGGTHDAIVFLRLWSKAATEAVKAGRLKLTDPIISYPAMALDRLDG